ncbi:hypothetical protein BCR35DRAFT_304251 [Leucosporidium creatinivorum]|uniref:Uncharacterized protein n=1 Tax=Leucosporidium creatinivorum TaxID=106004 RepID=A0A1Y2FAN4_9BASI|nr:hypothetical protein BCR35DRAFT_304251 [Leucosporidium creatinivorum]
MFGLPTRASYSLSAASPAIIDDITPRHTLNVQDFDGQSKQYTVTKACAKIVIYNSKNLTLRLQALPLTSTIELFGSAFITLILDCPSTSPPLGILQLDPTLSSVHIQYAHPALVGSIVLAPNLTGGEGERTFGFKGLSLQVGEEEAFELVDGEGRIHEPGVGGAVIAPESEEARGLPTQWVVKLGGEGKGWEAQPLKRSSSKEYPLL